MLNWDKVKDRRFFKTIEELQNSINEYFKDCFKEKDDPNITGLALYIGFSNRQSLFDYVNRGMKDVNGKSYTACIKKAKAFIEGNTEDKLNRGEGNQVGRIFILKNGFNWKDKTEIDQTIKGEMSMIDLLSKPKDNKEDNKD